MKIRIAKMKQLSHFILMLLLHLAESTQLDKDNYDIIDHMRKNNHINSYDDTPATSTINDKRNFSSSKNYTLKDDMISRNAVMSDRTANINDDKSREYRDTCIDTSDDALDRISDSNRVNDKKINIIDAYDNNNNNSNNNSNNNNNNNKIDNRNNEYPCNIKRINLKQQIDEIDYIEREVIDIYSNVPIIYEGLKDRNILLSYLASKYNLTSPPTGDVEVNVHIYEFRCFYICTSLLRQFNSHK
jgi:hypothetical protein